MAELDYEYLAKLVKIARTGDSEAFAELYAATYSKQYNFSYQYVKDPHIAQDILQDVYILVLKNLNALKDPRLFVSWLNQITFRVCYDYKRKLALRAQELAGDQDIYDTHSPGAAISPEKQIALKYQKTELMQQILSLKPKEAQAIIMRYYNNMTIEEIAGAMDCSRSTVKRRLISGKMALKSKINSADWGGVFND